MGNSASVNIESYIPPKCEICSLEYGEDAIFKIYHHGNSGGHVMCHKCYRHKNLHKLFSNKLSSRYTKQTCYTCGYTNIDTESRKLLKIYWLGKFGDKILCDKCVFDKKYRRNNAVI